MEEIGRGNIATKRCEDCGTEILRDVAYDHKCEAKIERDDHGEPIILVPDGGAVCNECRELYEPKPDYRWTPTNPLCNPCWQKIDEGMHGRRFAITTALMDRETGGGLMAQMSDERFERYVASQVRQFNEWRNKRG